MILKKYLFVAVVLVMMPTIQASSQDQRISPLNQVTSRYKDTYLKIVYSQPSKKGREIFGKLVPYGEVWRTGANEATELTVTTDILIDTKVLTAGTYSLFTIPGETAWTIILNSDLGLWGAYNYNPKKDILRFEVPVERMQDPKEAFTISIDSINDKAELFLMWDRTRVRIRIQYPEPKSKP